jgi:hypothetical protein
VPARENADRRYGQAGMTGRATSHSIRQREASDDVASMVLLVRRAFGCAAIAYAEHQRAAFAAAGEGDSAVLWGAILARLTVTAAAGPDLPPARRDAPVQA